MKSFCGLVHGDTQSQIAVFLFEISIGQCIKARVVSQNFIHKPENVLICSDSVAVLKSLRSFKSSHQDILFIILQMHTRIV